MKSLLARLSAALLAIMVLLGGCFFVVAEFSTRLYHEEITQRLNASIAMYIAGESQLISGGIVNRDALATLARHAMVVNPTVEIYLLDSAGKILGHALPPETVVADEVDLVPLRKLLDGESEMPIHGTDPRNADSRKVFSAWPVTDDGKLQGYVYAILGGKKYDALASNARSSYIRRLMTGALVAVVVGGFLIGILVFRLLTRRLTRLTRDVQAFTDADFDDGALHVSDRHADTSSRDEIGRLRTAFRRMAQQIRDQFETLKETDQLRRELVTNVSHDLRTPLASMHGYVETLLIRNDQLSAEERKHYLEITHKNSQRLTALVGELFELAKLESACVEPQLEYFSLAELLYDVSQEFELDAGDKGIDLGVESPRSPATVYADIGLVQRVLENLIRNALKYTPRGGRVNVSLGCYQDRVAVAVVDTGCGIAEDDMERVFDRYFSAGGDTGPEATASTGLGLAIVRRILDLHGCRITVSSTINQGTRFEFDLPTRHAA